MASTWLVEVELAADEDGETPDGELLISVLVVCLGGDVLEVGLVVGRICSLTEGV